MTNPISLHKFATHRLARSLNKTDVYYWLVDHGYFPESYVLPPCFSVESRPPKPKLFYKIKNKGRDYQVPHSECINLHFPKTELTDRTFGLINPNIHNDIAYHISRNWVKLVDLLIPKDSKVTSYSFPVPIDARSPGRLGYLRSGRMIYEFIAMTDKDVSAVAYKYSHIVKADIKNFYPSIYTHSIAWAIHGKKFIRKSGNKQNYLLLGNRLDRLFQRANDGCTNGIPIGPVVSDLIAEIIVAAVDRHLTKALEAEGVEYEAVRFKDDYRVLTKSESDARKVIKSLQAALGEFNLELSDEKTSISKLPDGLFRSWVSKYHMAYPRTIRKFSWKEFRELYISVIGIDRDCPGTGVIDRFLSDITKRDGSLKVSIDKGNLQKIISMLLMLASLRVKAFPKVLAIIEKILQSNFGLFHKNEIVEYLESYLTRLATEESRNKYLISWISYFLVSHDLVKLLTKKPKFKDPITKSIFNSRCHIFKDCSEFKLFVGSKTAAKKHSMFKYLDVFYPPKNLI